MFSFLQKINSKRAEQKSFSLFVRNSSHHNSHKESNSPDFVYADSSKLTDSLPPPLPPATPTKSNSIRSNSEKHSSSSKSPSKNHFSRKSNLSFSSIGSGYFTTGRFDNKKKSLGFKNAISLNSKSLIKILTYFYILKDYVI